MNENNKKIRIGVLGTANIALRSIIPEIQNLKDEYDLVGVATRNLQNKTDTIPELNLIEGYDQLLDEEIIDAVYIPLPNSMHYEWVKYSLNKGLHVLVEKSMACSHAEVVELNNIAREKDLVLVENFQFRFHSQLTYILRLLKEKLLGELRCIRSSFCFPPFSDKNNIRYNESLGGGALLDSGAYPVKLSQILLGNDVKVTSAVLNKEKDFNVDIWGGAFIEQQHGNLFSQVTFGFDHYYQCNVEIVGSKGKLYTNRIFTAGDSIKPKIILETNANGLEEVELEPDNHFRNMLLYFYKLIAGLEDRNGEYSDNINQARLLEELKLKSNEA